MTELHYWPDGGTFHILNDGEWYPPLSPEAETLVLTTMDRKRAEELRDKTIYRIYLTKNGQPVFPEEDIR